MSITSITLFRFDTAWSKVWAFTQMGWARRPLARIPGIGFHKLFGSGTGEGFTPIPNTGVYGILGTWADLDAAQSAIAGSAVFQRYREAACESWTVYLQCSQCRGQWDGTSPFEVFPDLPRGGQVVPNEDNKNAAGKIAVLTRATVRVRHVPAFWRQVPDIEETIRGQKSLLVKIGLGEVPWLHQVTFTVWDDVEAMKRFAYAGFHGDAIEKVRAGGWFKEELFSRFHVLQAEGAWEGRDPFAPPASRPGNRPVSRVPHAAE